MAADSLKNGPFERDVEQAITALKKGTHLLKYGRRGKPKFCPFRLSNDLESIQRCSTNYDARAFANFGNIFSDVIVYTGQERSTVSTGSVSTSNSVSSGSADTSNGGVSGVDNNVRVSYSSAVSSSSYGSGDDFDSLGDVLIWGKGVGDCMLAYASHISGNLHGSRSDVSSPKALESTVLLDIHSVACGSKHSVLVTKQGEMYSWGEESGGRLGHSQHR